METSRPGKTSYLAQRYDKRVRNITSSVIPPFAVLKIAGATKYSDDEIYNVSQPIGSGSEKYLINGPGEIAVGGEGSATDQYPAVAAYDPGAPPQTPIPGSLWGPFGGFSLSINGSGFLILGAAENGLVRVAEAPPLATAGADFPLIIVRNDSGLSRVSRSIFGLNLPLNLPPAQLPIQPIWSSAPPEAGKLWVVSLDNVAADNFVDCAPIGILAVQINYRGQEYVNESLVHRFVDAAESNYGVLDSAQDGPGRILWRERQAVNGSATQGIQWAFIDLDHQGVISAPRAVITEAVTAASGTRGGILTPGKGKAQLYVSAGGVAGASWVPGDIVDVETWMHGTTAVGKPVGLRPSRRLPNGHTIYEIVAEGCAVVPLPPP